VHHQEQNDQPYKPLQEMRQNANAVIGIAQIISTMLCPWLHRPGTAGSRFYSGRAALSWAFIPVFGAVFHQQESVALLILFWLATTLLLVINRMLSVVARLRGDWQHSKYDGRPWIPGPEYSVKVMVEPFVAIGIGLLVMTFDKPFGGYLTLAGVCLGINGVYQWSWDQARINAVRDAQADAEQLGDWVNGDR
jgi:hypothetical protein